MSAPTRGALCCGEPFYGMEESDDITMLRPTLLIMGMKRSGKTSIHKVVFAKMAPRETIFVESTNKVTKQFICSSFIKFEMQEFPGQLNPFDPVYDPVTTFNRTDAIIYVLDSQDDLVVPVSRMIDYYMQAREINPKIKFEVFVHKIDHLSDHNRIFAVDDVYDVVKDEMRARKLDVELFEPTYHLTTIYDHTIFEELSKIVQELVPQLPTIEKLLDIFNLNTKMDKSFLIDLTSKIYVASDSLPVNHSHYELCCDIVDMAMEITSIYGGPPYRKDEEKSVCKRQGLFDDSSAAMIRLKAPHDQVMFMRQLDKYLGLVCITKVDKLEKEGLIDHNFTIFKESMKNVFRVTKHAIRERAIRDEAEKIENEKQMEREQKEAAEAALVAATAATTAALAGTSLTVDEAPSSSNPASKAYY